jgi:hypothetical protein
MYCEDILHHTSNGPFRRIRQLWKSAPNYLQRKNPAAEATGKGSGEGVHRVTIETSGSEETITPSGSASPRAMSSSTILSTVL